MEDEFLPEYFDYNLKGVVIHMGTADSGHYYSLISDCKDKNISNSDDNWLEFNDVLVRKFDINDLAPEAFGGDEKNISMSMMGNLTKSMKEKSKNAYLLFYQRSKNFDENGQELPQLVVPEKLETNSRIFDEIKEDNVKYYINRNCFDPEFSNFIHKMISKMVDNNRISDPLAIDFFKLGLLHFFAVVVRYRDRERLIPSMAKILKKALSNNSELSNWFLMNASSEETIKETLIECPIRDIKYIFSGFYIEAIKKAIDDKKEAGYRMINMCLTLLTECKERKLMDIFYRTFIPYSKQSKVFKQYLLDKKMIYLLFLYICEQNIPVAEFSFPRPPPLESNEIGGLVTEKKAINIRSIEEIVEKKKEKLNLENVSVNYANLIITLSNLVCSITFNELPTLSKSGKATTSTYLVEPLIEYKLSEEEKKILFTSIFWKKILYEGQNKISWKPIGRFFSHLSFGNKQVTLEVMKLGLDEISASDENLKVYLKMFESLMLIDDEFRTSRIKYLTEKLMLVFKDGMKYYKFSITLLEFFFKICGKHSLVLKAFSEYFSENKSIFRSIEDWIKSLKDLSYHLNSGHFQIFKKKKAIYNSQFLQLSNFFMSLKIY